VAAWLLMGRLDEALPLRPSAPAPYVCKLGGDLRSPSMAKSSPAAPLDVTLHAGALQVFAPAQS
jgi:hypothetical protein